MSSSSLKVQCLASTRTIAQSWQDQKSEAWGEDGEKEVDRRIDVHTDAKDNGPPEVLTEGIGSMEEPTDTDDKRVPSRSPAQPDSRTDVSDSASESEASETITASIGSTHIGEMNHTSCIQEAQLSPDGTCVFTSDFDRSFSMYPIDHTSYNETGTQHLKPYAKFTSADPIWAFAANPLFDVNDANSTHVLVSRRDRYITLHNALWDISKVDNERIATSTKTAVDISTPLTSYKLVNSLTEAVTAPSSLAYSHSGTHFFAGTRNSIHIFDLEYPDEPTHTISTIPSARSKLKGGGRGFKGVVTALTLSPPTLFSNDGMLTAGARTRHVGIYDAQSGSEISTFSLPGTVDGKKLVNSNMQHIIGDGVTSLKYSPCGKYLYVAERNSDVLLIYDVRNFSLGLGYCAGRQALTKQKLGFDVWNAGASPYDIEATSHEVWAGGTDGMIRVWRDPYIKQGAVDADKVFQVGCGDAPVVGTMVHASGGMAVAACGTIEVGDEKVRGKRRGGGILPKYKEWGSVDILGLS